MLQITQVNPATKTIEIVVDGRVTRESILDIYREVEEKGKSWGQVNFLEEFLGFDGIEPRAIWEDLRLYLKNSSLFKKVALVTDKKWVSTLTKIADPLFKIDVKVFPLDKISEARLWLATK
ncbi:STAS/SEC14 domain-containing protein [Peredibacter sp. HCB2-198]|uniref:STAS/SEC14 domain-containing protein n=1 Tax=Peredibacter sp. HCB2-198 TaxID=3383025 RepID=UPI0038B41C20